MEKTVNGYKIVIENDPHPYSPREYDNLGKMICFHRNYDLGDKHNYDAGEFSEYLHKNRNRLIILPLYLYDHSGITMSTTPFGCIFDSGQVGFIYVSKLKVRSEYGWKKITKENLEKINQYLKSEVEEYDKYIRGEAYGYRITKDGEETDSCWGYSDEDYCMSEAEDVVNGYK